MSDLRAENAQQAQDHINTLRSDRGVNGTELRKSAIVSSLDASLQM
jgi:hypothetical protein